MNLFFNSNLANISKENDMSRLDYTIDNLTCNKHVIELLDVLDAVVTGTDVDKNYIHIKYTKMNNFVLSYYTSSDFLMESELVCVGDVFTFTSVPDFGKSNHDVVTIESSVLSRAFTTCTLAGGFN